MKRLVYAGAIALTGIVLGCSTFRGTNSGEFHVASNGSDVSGNGSIGKPFQTLERARDAVRATVSRPSTVDRQPSTIYLHGGTYKLDKTLVLDPQDSRVTWKAYKDEKPVITSAREITGWKRLSDLQNSSLSLLTNHLSLTNIWTADVRKDWRFHFLYVDGQPATRSRSVNNENWRQWGRAFSFAAATPTGQVVTFHNKDLIKGLPSNGGVEMCAIIYQFGVMGGGVMTDFDPEKGTGVWHSKQLNLHGARGGSETSFRLENALAFIDEPGEWAVDSAAGKVFYWPKAGEDLTKSKITAPTLNELIHVQGDDAKKSYVKNVLIENLTLFCTDRLPEDQWPDNWTVRQWENPDAMIFMEGVENCAVRNCRLYRSGSYGVTLYRHALSNEISGCEIGWTGSGGVQLFGFGAGFRDENKENVVRRNYIHDQGCSIYWHSPNIQIYGSGGNLVEYNFLAMSAYNNVSITGVRMGALNDGAVAVAGRHQMITDNTDTFSVDFSTYPPDILAQIKAGKPYFTWENYRDLALHSRNNKLYRNIAVECNARLEEGGALYSWYPGKGNQYIENVVYKSHALPGSSILALDDASGYFTLTSNVVWTVGRAGCGTIGVRPWEPGNIFTANIRAGYKPEYGDSGHCTTEPDRKSFDSLYNTIKTEVDKSGGWPGNPDINAWIDKLKSENRFELTPDEIKTMNKLM